MSHREEGWDRVGRTDGKERKGGDNEDAQLFVVFLVGSLIINYATCLVVGTCKCCGYL